MSYQQNASYVRDLGAISSAEERAGFMRRVYTHLIIALAAFVGLEAVFQTTIDQKAILGLLGGGKFSWLIVMGVYMALGWVARKLAFSESSRQLQYAGLAFGILVEAAIFMPLIFVARSMDPSGSLLVNAGLMTSVLFVGLVATVLMTKKDFSFLKSALVIGSILAFGVIVVAIFMDISLGFWFSVAMIVLMAGAILYQTSQIYRDYPSQMYVPAAFVLFTSFTALLWYVINLLLSKRE